MTKLTEVNKFRGKDLSVFNHNLSLPRHRWYTFKEGFSESLVKTAIDSVKSRNSSVALLDPFSGSGTSVVTAGRLGHSATGIELNPFLAFAGGAKSVPRDWERVEFQETLKKVLSDSAVEVRSPLEGKSTFTEHPGITKWLFNRSVLRGFTALDNALLETGKYHKPLRLGLFASLIEHCNARRDGKCLRYRKNWEKNGFTSAELRADFAQRANNIFDDISKFDFLSEGLTIIKGDTKEVLQEMEGDQFDLTVMSPPYLNSFDYSDVYRPELFIGGFISDNGELTQLRKKTVRSHVQVKWDEIDASDNPRLLKILPLLSTQTFWSNQIPLMISAYFADMTIVLRESARTVKNGGQAWIVVSTSAYGGVEIPVDLVLADIAEEVGWKLKSVNVLRRLRSAGQHHNKSEVRKKMPLRESLIILEK